MSERASPPPEARGPVRTCVGCRRRAPARELLALVLVDDRVVLAPARRRRPAGRGAWLCPSQACLSAALRTRAFGRAFKKAAIVPDPESLAKSVESAIESADPSKRPSRIERIELRKTGISVAPATQPATSSSGTAERTIVDTLKKSNQTGEPS